MMNHILGFLLSLMISFGSGTPRTSLTADIEDDFLMELRATSFRLNPNEPELAEWILLAMTHESNINPHERDHSGAPYFGLIQLGRPGFPGMKPEEFMALSAVEQLPYVEKYYRPAAKHFHSRANLEQYNFLPSSLARGTAPETKIVIDGADGYGGMENSFYASNRRLDVDDDGSITVQDLDASLDRVSRYPRFKEALDRLRALGLPTAARLLP